VNPSRFLGFVGMTTKVIVVGLFLATILGSVSLDFTVEAQVASHKFCFLGFGVLLSSASDGVNVCGFSSVDVHMVSSLRGGTFPIVSPIVSSVTASSGVVALPRGKFECLEESLTPLGELSCCLPFEMGFVGLFFPFLEGPRGFSGRVIGGGINDGASESLSHSVFESFNGSLVI